MIKIKWISFFVVYSFASMLVGVLAAILMFDISETYKTTLPHVDVMLLVISIVTVASLSYLNNHQGMGYRKGRHPEELRRFFTQHEDDPRSWVFMLFCTLAGASLVAVVYAWCLHSVALGFWPMIYLILSPRVIYKEGYNIIKSPVLRNLIVSALARL